MLTVLRIPELYRRRMRTTHGLERITREIKRRTRVAALFPNEASLLRLASARSARSATNEKPKGPP